MSDLSENFRGYAGWGDHNNLLMGIFPNFAISHIIPTFPIFPIFTALCGKERFSVSFKATALRHISFERSNCYEQKLDAWFLDFASEKKNVKPFLLFVYFLFEIYFFYIAYNMISKA